MYNVKIIKEGLFEINKSGIYELIKDNYLIGRLCYIVHSDEYRNDDELFLRIVSLSIDKDYRNIGFGTMLLKEIMNDVLKHGIYRISLSDVSDNYGQKNNIYRRLGLRYIYDNEMVGNIRAIISKKV